MRNEVDAFLPALSDPHIQTGAKAFQAIPSLKLRELYHYNMVYTFAVKLNLCTYDDGV